MTTFSQNLNNLVTATLLADDQQRKTETDNTNEKKMDIDESAKAKISFRIVTLSK